MELFSSNLNIFFLRLRGERKRDARTRIPVENASSVKQNKSTWLEKSSFAETLTFLDIIWAQLRAPFNTIVLCDAWGVTGVLFIDPTRYRET